MGSGGFAPLLLSAPGIIARVENQVNGALLAIVSNSTQGPVAKSGPIEIPLPANANIPTGTPVRVELIVQGGVKTIQITPQPNAPGQPVTPAQATAQSSIPPSPTNTQPTAPPTASSPAPPTTAAQSTAPPTTSPQAPAQPASIVASDATAHAASQAVRQAAQHLTGVPALVRAAAQLTPDAPQPNAPVERVAAVLNTMPPIAPDIQVLVNAVQSAGQARVIPQQVVDAFIGMFSRVSSEGSTDWQVLLRQAARASGRTIEGRMAQTAVRNQPFTWNPAQPDGDVRAAILWLISNTSFRRALASQGMEKPVMDAATRMADRIAGAQILNAHAGDQPYLFLELPFSDTEAFNRAQIHIAGDGQGNDVDPNRATVVLDLDLSQLGPLWISLQVFDGRCICTIRAQHDAAMNALNNEADTLSSALEGAGYESARVTVHPWDGDRVEMLNNAMGSAPGGMDVSA